MTLEQAKACLAAGAEVVADLAKQGVKMLGLGEMGIGNTTPSAAIAAVVMALPVEEVTGRGTGLDVEAWKKKVAVIQGAIALNKADAKDGMDVLVKLGGFEIGVLAGAILEASKRRMPVMLDGFISGAAALVAYRIDPACKDSLLAGHQSVEIGHRRIHEFLGLKPLLQLELRLGEGTGAAMAFMLVDAACKIVAEMATFDSAGVSQDKTGKDAFEKKEA
jgi:nicotinate-nucleotide--dimethylbenzimidazole phosphoribosyltransferase